MTINGSGSMQQMQQQMQMRKMDGTGGGHGMQKGGGSENGMKDVMQSLSEEDRTTLQNELNNISSDDKNSIKEQLKSIDSSSMSSEEYFSSLMDVVNPSTTLENTKLDLYV